jgi:hypothetical protein
MEFIELPQATDFISLSDILAKFVNAPDMPAVFSHTRPEVNADKEFNAIHAYLEQRFSGALRPLVTEICVFDPNDQTQQRFFNIVSGVSKKLVDNYIEEMRENIKAERNRTESNAKRGAIIPKSELYEHVALWSYLEPSRGNEHASGTGHAGICKSESVRFRAEGHFRAGWGTEASEDVDANKVREYSKAFLDAFCNRSADEPEIQGSERLLQLVIPFSRAGGRLIGQLDPDSTFHKGGALLCVASFKGELDELMLIKTLSSLSRLLSDAVIRSSYFQADYKQAASVGTLVATTGFSHQFNKISSRICDDWLVSFQRWQGIKEWNKGLAIPISLLEENAMVCPAPAVFKALQANLRIWSLTINCSELFDVLPRSLTDVANQALEYALQRFLLIKARNMKFSVQNSALRELDTYDRLGGRTIDFEELRRLEFASDIDWGINVSYGLNKAVSGLLRLFTGIIENFIEHSADDSKLFAEVEVVEDCAKSDDQQIAGTTFRLGFTTSKPLREKKERTALGFSGTDMLKFIVQEFLNDPNSPGSPYDLRAKRFPPADLGEVFKEEVQLFISSSFPIRPL